MSADDRAKAAVLGAAGAILSDLFLSMVFPNTGPAVARSVSGESFYRGAEMALTVVADAVEEDPDAAADALRSGESVPEVLFDLGEIAGYVDRVGE